MDATIYDLRHSYCSLLIHEGRSVPYVAAAMGHASGVTTLTHYAHLFDEQRLGTGMPMVDAIGEARRGCAQSVRRRRAAAPTPGRSERQEALNHRLMGATGAAGIEPATLSLEGSCSIH